MSERFTVGIDLGRSWSGSLPEKLLFGAAYYHEYQPYERLATDLDLMKAAHFSVIRVGESVWSTWEPEEGVFDVDWLAPIVDGAHERGISVIVGTPSYAVPPWLRSRYPETTAQRRSGQAIPYGGRQNADFSHPTYRRLVERLVRRIVDRYAGHPAVIGWQVDNEPGIELLHNPGVFSRFVAELCERYGDVQTLNDRWGLTYWSHRLSAWDELWPPDGNTDPPYDLAWRRFQARLTAEFIEWQAGLVRKLARPDQFVTTCLALNRPAVDNVGLMRPLDVTAVNIYFPMQDALTMPGGVDRPEMRPAWLARAGISTLFWQADASRGVRQEPFLVTETHAASIGEHSVTYPPYDGQLRQAAWAMIARGARMIEYWHWHTLHFGNETFWGGVLGHGLEPGRIYDEVARLGAELQGIGHDLSGLEPDADVTLLFSPESRWALQFQPPLVVPGSSQPDRESYARIVGAVYRGLFDAGLSTAVLQPDQLEPDVAAFVRRCPVLVAPALYVASDDLLAWLAAYVAEGGHLVATFLTGCTDDEGRVRAEVMPGSLAAVAGVHYLESSNLATVIPLRPATGVSFEGGGATGWADGLVVGTATPLAWYDHPHFGRWPAITTNVHGAGRLTYVGTLPDAALARSLGEWVASLSGAEDPWRSRGGTISSHGARTPRGRRVRFLFNWSWEPSAMTAPLATDDLLNGGHLHAGSSIELGAWDVRVLVESGGPDAGRV
jgi:beta-galactosidase